MLDGSGMPAPRELGRASSGISRVLSSFLSVLRFQLVHRELLFAKRIMAFIS